MRVIAPVITALLLLVEECGVEVRLLAKTAAYR